MVMSGSIYPLPPFGNGPKMADPQASYQVSETIVGWILGACGSLILLLIGLGVKSIKDDIMDAKLLRKEFADYKLGAERDRGDLRRTLAELGGDIQRLSDKIEDTIR